MAKTLARIAVGAAIVAALEGAVIAFGPWSGPGAIEAYGIFLLGTGAFILILSVLAVLGPNVDSTSGIRPMQGNFAVRERRLGSFGTGGGGAVLVSSGTRSLWDPGADPRLRGAAPKVYTAVGIAGVLIVVGGLLLLL